MHVPDRATRLRVDGIDLGSVGAGWRERTLAPPTPFRLDAGVLTLGAGLRGFEARSAALAGWALRMREERGLPGWRNETVVVRASARADARALFAIERALLRPLGLLLRSVQACAWTVSGAGPRLWVARRSQAKPVDPGRLDALVGGGIAGFDEAWPTLMRECAEEAGIPEPLARQARPAGTLETDYDAIDAGLAVRHREHLALFELRLPPDFVPVAADGEHACILAMTPAEALASIAAGEWTREGGQATVALIGRRGWAPRSDAGPRRAPDRGPGEA
jgi:8-oxo-dGTP pyrophosphatase MutT (NUDIX family)